jgi:adenosylcobinamide kinase/adenosylcobinamide-phosphate guanylyltransferase
VGELVFILGGTRSGKSRFGRERAFALGGDDVTFVATAWPGDPELDARIAAHRKDRPAAWLTIEPRDDLAGALRSVEPDRVVLIDSLTLWASACFERRIDIASAWDDVSRAIAERERPVVLVSDEVGLGTVPMSSVVRSFRDELGRLHQRASMQATTVALLVAGLPVFLKGTA